MKKFYLAASLLLATATLSACGYSAVPAVVAAKTVSATAQLNMVTEGGYKLLALQKNVTADDVGYIVLSVTPVGSASGLTTTIQRANMNAPVVLSNLNYDTTYVINAKAYSAIGNQTQELTVAGGSETSFSTPKMVDTNGTQTIETNVNIGSILVELHDVVYLGQASTGEQTFDVQKGDIIQTSADEKFGPIATAASVNVGSIDIRTVTNAAMPVAAGEFLHRVRNFNNEAVAFEIRNTAGTAVLAKGVVGANSEAFVKVNLQMATLYVNGVKIAASK